MRTTTRWVCFFAIFLVGGCLGAPDSDRGDGGVLPDGSIADGGTDAGNPPDGGTTDAGGTDGGTLDGGTTPASGGAKQPSVQAGAPVLGRHRADLERLEQDIVTRGPRPGMSPLV